MEAFAPAVVIVYVPHGEQDRTTSTRAFFPILLFTRCRFGGELNASVRVVHLINPLYF